MAQTEENVRLKCAHVTILGNVCTNFALDDASPPSQVSCLCSRDAVVWFLWSARRGGHKVACLLNTFRLIDGANKKPTLSQSLPSRHRLSAGSVQGDNARHSWTWGVTLTSCLTGVVCTLRTRHGVYPFDFLRQTAGNPSVWEL